MSIVTANITPQVKPGSKGNFPSMNGNNLYIIDLDTAEYLGLQGMPTSLDYDPKSKFTDVASPMRNNPLILFSSSNDIIEFDLSWFSNEVNKIDVIARCKWLESMTKADGYGGRPHFAKFKWGKLFDQSTWFITSAKYKVSNFDKTLGYLPTTATQKVIIQRVVITNPTINEITNYQW